MIFRFSLILKTIKFHLDPCFSLFVHPFSFHFILYYRNAFYADGTGVREGPCPRGRRVHEQGLQGRGGGGIRSGGTVQQLLPLRAQE